MHQLPKEALRKSIMRLPLAEYGIFPSHVWQEVGVISNEDRPHPLVEYAS